jgi:hypothetical protein
MRIRPLHIALIAVAAGAAYSIVSVVASFAEIKSVGEQMTAAVHARAQRSPPPEALAAPEAARGEAASGESGDEDSPGSLDLVDRPEAAREPSRAAERYDTRAGEIEDAVAREEEERYLTTVGRRDSTDELDGPEQDSTAAGEEDPGFAETVDDADSTLGDASDEDADQQ